MGDRNTMVESRDPKVTVVSLGQGSLALDWANEVVAASAELARKYNVTLVGGATITGEHVLPGRPTPEYAVPRSWVSTQDILVRDAARRLLGNYEASINEMTHGMPEERRQHYLHCHPFWEDLRVALSELQ